MCLRCSDVNAKHDPDFRRRRFLAGAAAATAMGAAAGFAKSAEAAAKAKAPPKPENALSPDAALARLMEGNKRYVQGVAKRHDFKHEREPLTRGQNPYAAILSCADSRIAPEYCFDAGRGDLFVCRVAGNFANAESIASFEYAVHVLSVPLMLVLGHDSCGAVDATITSLKDGTTLPGHLPSLIDALAPAVKDVLAEPGDTLKNAIRRNVVRTTAALSAATPILSAAVADKKLVIAGGIYDLATGKVVMVG
jgi:carbonic anhydrase